MKKHSRKIQFRDRKRKRESERERANNIKEEKTNKQIIIKIIILINRRPNRNESRPWKDE